MSTVNITDSIIQGSLHHGFSSEYPAGVPRHLNYPKYPAWGLLAQAAAKVSARPACVFMNHSLSYREINLFSIELAIWLRSHGLRAGDRVAVLLPNCPEYWIALNGIWRAGGVAVAVSPLSVANDVTELVGQTSSRFVICLDVLTELIRGCSYEKLILTSLCDYLPTWKQVGYIAARWRRTGTWLPSTTDRQHWFWDIIRASKDELPVFSAIKQDSPAYILSTGGTTGNPRAVTLSHRNIVCNAWQQRYWSGASMGKETLLAVLPFFHSYGMSTMLAGGAAMGATLIMQPRFHVARAIGAIEKFRPTVFHAVPAMLAAMNLQLQKRPANLRSLKWVISGGAALPVQVAEEFASYSQALVVEGYGLSEASPVTHVGPLDGSNRWGTIGLPLPDTDCRIVDLEEPHRDMPRGEVGELWVRGPQVMLGYWQNEKATQAVLADGWLQTGDLACLDADGKYRIVDRKKDLIITSGFNVYPADVEEVLRSHPAVRDVAIIGVPHAECGEVVKAFIVLEEGFAWNENELVEFSRKKLAAHRRPRIWEQMLGDLPRNFLGKVIRRQLRESEGDQP
ncbi:MAG: AMP-binding protein [Planctomycetales bacterium]|nr:AMP-binding protein [Planctomycetales bacterium]